MHDPHLDFKNLRKHRNSQNDGFEELTRQLVLAQPPDLCTKVENRGPGADGGVEILARFADGSVWGWQSKFFLDDFGASEIGQIKKSFSAALTNFTTLERYYVAIPRNLSGAAVGKQKTQTQYWADFLVWAAKEAAKAGRLIKIELWDESYFIKRLQSNDPLYTGMRAYWFQETVFTSQWFERRFIESRKFIGKRYRENDHIDLSVNHTLCFLRRTPDFFEKIRSFQSAINEALEYADRLAESTHKSVSMPAAVIYEALKASIVETSKIPVDSYYDHPAHSAVLAAKEINRSLPQLHELLEELYRKKESTVEPELHKQNYLHDDSIRHRINKLREIIGKAAGAISNLEAQLLHVPHLLVCGEAGSGKSHLLAEEVRQHIKNGSPACFVPSRIIDNGDKPQSEILDFLSLSGIQFDTFLSAMSAAAYAAGGPALIVIDGINESFKAAGWESGLPVLLEMVKRYENLVLIVSVRNEYRKLCIRTGLEIPTLQHYGFRGDLGNAVKEYLDRHGIERPSAPINGMRDILNNPLFLSTAVDALVKLGRTSFPRDLDNISELIAFWIDAIERNLVDKGFERISLGDSKIRKVIDLIAEQMAKSGDETLSFDTAYRLSEEVVGLAAPSAARDRFIQRLIDEGVFIDYPSYGGGAEKYITFGFQKFSDYFIADYLLKKSANKEVLANSLLADGQFGYLFDKEKFHSYAGIRTALFSLVPLRFGCELPDLRDGFNNEIPMRVNEFIGSLTWRSAKGITAKTVDYLENVRARKPEAGYHALPDEDWYKLLLNLALMPDCVLNANYLAEELRRQPLPSRDATWSAYLVGRYEQYEDDWEIVFQIIDWAWLAPKPSIDSRIAKLAAITLALFTSTSDRQLRDCASKALANLLVEFPEQIAGLIDFFSEWDDAYVRERVLAASLAGVLYSDDRAVWRDAAIATDKMVFKKQPVEWHAWTRRYGQLIVDHAANNYADLVPDLAKRAKPPYASKRIVNWPTIHDIGPKKDDARSIVNSVVGYISEPYEKTDPGFAGDFGRYTMGGIDRHFSLEARRKSPPKTRKKRTEEFWKAVGALGKKASRQSKSLREIYGETNSIKVRRKIFNLESWSDQQLKDIISDEEQQRLIVKKLEAEAEFIAMLPDKLADEYKAIEPLNRYKANGIPMFPMQRAQCWVVQRCLDLGWEKNLHESIETNMRVGSYGRYDHSIERIGKKYQHIAYQELIGYLADHHWFVEGYNDHVGILNGIEIYERADIDISFFAGSFSRPSELYDPGKIKFPEINFEPGSVESNKEWATHCKDAPDPIPFLVQTGSDGYSWAMVTCFTRNLDYMELFNSDRPLRSCQYSMELILIPEKHAEQITKLNSITLKGDDRDVFEHGGSSSAIYAQRQFRGMLGCTDVKNDTSVAKIPFFRVSEGFSPKYSGYDNSGTTDEDGFTTPKYALIEQLKLKPMGPWSRLFVNEQCEPVFIDRRTGLGDACIIRFDMLEKFAAANKLKPVWRVWVEKDGGRGTGKGMDRTTFVRKDYIGFFLNLGNCWTGEFFPYRN